MTTSVTAGTPGLFVTGTDTGVGKTCVSVCLLTAASALGCRTVGMKPVSAGCEPTADGLRNDDALALQTAASLERPYQQVNPVALAPAIAPHIAAAEANSAIDLRRIQRAFARLVRGADFCVVEGAGGWLVPLNRRSDLADLALRLKLPVVLVVGIRLGCLNHALLTQESILNRNLPVAGWVANVLDTSARPEANIEALCQRIEAPLIARVPQLTNPTRAAFQAAFDAAGGPDWLRRLMTSNVAQGRPG